MKKLMTILFFFFVLTFTKNLSVLGINGQLSIDGESKREKYDTTADVQARVDELSLMSDVSDIHVEDLDGVNSDADFNLIAP